MSNKNTFDIRCIKNLITSYLSEGYIIIDPFANKNRIGTITNDLDPSFGCDFNMDALDFLKNQPSDFADVVLYDPPYSVRQVSESYKKMGLSVNMETTQSSYWSNQKKEIGRIVKFGGVVLSFGWNSAGIGKKYGFEIVEILLVSHGGAHNDTICTVDVKI